MEVIRKVTELKAAVELIRQKGSIGFVPTMGALHKGHIALVNKCKDECSSVIVSLFVNPTQFNDKSDLKNYPRTEIDDIKLLEKAGCDIAFIPSVEEIYPEKDTRQFEFGILESVMEGASRPGHFNGVAQVVSRLFDIVTPDKAYFGEKDFQQLAIIRNMVDMLGYKIEVVGCPIIRDSDGLALSSRNALLSAEQRSVVPVIYMTLREAISRKQWCSVEELKAWVIEQINSNDMLEVDYFSIVDSKTLQDIVSWDDTCEKRGCIAVKVGTIRLIDNINI